MGKKEFKDGLSKLAKHAWVPTFTFIEILSEQKDNNIKIQEIGKKADWVRLLDVNREEVTFESFGKVKKLPIARINCFATNDDWRCQKKH